MNERTLAPTLALRSLLILNQIFRFAARRGWIAENPVGKLEPGEKPRWKRKQVAILEPAVLGRVLEHAGSHRTLFESIAYTGIRIGEALGLCWADVDFEAGVLPGPPAALKAAGPREAQDRRRTPGGRARPRRRQAPSRVVDRLRAQGAG